MSGTTALVLRAADAIGNDDDLNYFDIETGLLRGENQFKLVPGLTTTITVPPDATAMIMSSGSVATAATSAQEYSAADIVLFIDGHAFVSGGYQRVIAAPPINVASWNLHLAYPLGPGEHTFAIKARGVPGGLDATVGGLTRPASGALTVMILKR